MSEHVMAEQRLRVALERLCDAADDFAWKRGGIGGDLGQHTEQLVAEIGLARAVLRVHAGTRMDDASRIRPTDGR